MPAAVLSLSVGVRGSCVAAMMIGVGPHRGSHTAVAVGADERQLGGLRVRDALRMFLLGGMPAYLRIASSIRYLPLTIPR